MPPAPGLLRPYGPRNDQTKETTIKPLLFACLAALAAPALLPDDASARHGVRRPRVVIVAPRYRFFDEPGTIYGYAPGNYIPGPNGILYGPYPVRPPVVRFVPYGPDYYAAFVIDPDGYRIEAYHGPGER